MTSLTDKMEGLFQDEHPVDCIDGETPVETYGYEETYNGAVRDCIALVKAEEAVVGKERYDSFEKWEEYDFIHNIATRQAHAKASLIDEHMARFLCEHGFKTTPFTAESIKKELRDKGFELVQEIQKHVASEEHTFKLCKVYAIDALNIPNPEITII